MKVEAKNKILFMIYALCLGAIIGTIIYGFMKLVSLCTYIIWEKIPNIIQIPFYTILICTVGGIIIGVWKKFTGDYPEEMEKVIEKTKKERKYSYDKMGVMCVSAFLPLIFGASVGPESGLIGIIVGLCSWLTDKFKHMFKEMKELTQIGISATLGTIFNSPMFGFALPIESEEDSVTIPKASKVVLYFLSIFGALGAAMLLGHLFGGSSGLASFEGLKIEKSEWIFLIPLCFIGVLGGVLYLVFNKVTHMISQKLEKFVIIKCIIAGVLLGIGGTLLPLVMFSGEEQMGEVITNFRELGIIILLLTGVVKLFITNVCNSLGLKGGHFFPNIFSGICLGYAFALILGINTVFSVCIVTTALMAYLMKKPFAAILLLMICFPPRAVPVMLLAAVIGSYIKIPKFLTSNE